MSEENDFTMVREGVTLRRFGPKRQEHPSVGEACALCGCPMEAGDYTTLYPVGPVDEENRRKMEEGRAYTTEAREAHWTCASRLPTTLPEDLKGV